MHGLPCPLNFNRLGHKVMVAEQQNVWTCCLFTSCRPALRHAVNIDRERA
eukprot:m.126103 g.126103  ORF g.126103 m.126103 type:complete len:50 (+) comp13560_c0_seq2:432-581(+)